MSKSSLSEKQQKIKGDIERKLAGAGGGGGGGGAKGGYAARGYGNNMYR